MMVLNSSPIPITKLTIGWVLSGRLHSGPPAQVLEKGTGNLNDVYIHAGSIGFVGVQKWRTTEIFQLISVHPEYRYFEAVVGVLYAGLEDGSKFEIDMEKAVGFQASTDPSLFSLYGRLMTPTLVENFKLFNQN